MCDEITERENATFLKAGGLNGGGAVNRREFGNLLNLSRLGSRGKGFDG